MTESRSGASLGIYGPPRFTGGGAQGTSTPASIPSETDERGILRELTAHQIEQLTRDQILGYQKQRNEQLENRYAKEIEDLDFERYKEAFVAAGGAEKDARAAWEAQKKSEATQAAQHAATDALHASRWRVRQGL
jgi:hypothetical protein